LEEGEALAEAWSRTEAAAVDNAAGVAARVPQPTRHGWDGIYQTTISSTATSQVFAGGTHQPRSGTVAVTDIDNDDIAQWWALRSGRFR
jgi:hypothetical protein